MLLLTTPAFVLVFVLLRQNKLNFDITGLTPGDSYDVYLVAEDDALNTTEIKSEVDVQAGSN